MAYEFRLLYIVVQNAIPDQHDSMRTEMKISDQSDFWLVHFPQMKQRFLIPVCDEPII